MNKCCIFGYCTIFNSGLICHIIGPKFTNPAVDAISPYFKRSMTNKMHGAIHSELLL